MPSNEDYLNDLLKEMPDEDILAGDGQAPDLDALSELSEEQIARLLAEGEAGARPVREAEAEDVLDLADTGRDSDLQEIQELLKKSDRNEAVDDVGRNQSEENPADKLLEDIEKAGETEVAEQAMDTKKEKAQEKKRLKAEKKAAREAARAEKKAQREAKKKKAGKKAAQAEQGGSAQGSPVDAVQEYDMLLDKELLDSIVSEAGKVESGSPAEQEAPQVDLMEVAAALEAERNVDISQEVPYMEENAASGTAMDDGVLALDMDEVDEYVPDITDSVKEEEPKKKGMVSKFVDFLMEEEEEPENENVPISDENQEIIREMDNEEAEKARKKTQKKSQKKEKKKAKKKKEPKPKKAKPPKPKKEKKPKEADPYPVRKLGFKKVLPVVLLGASVGAVIFIFVNLFADYGTKQTARTAFDSGDYQTCYTYLHGKKRSEAEEQMYQKSQCILHIRMWYREYEMLAADGNELQALDNLIQSVSDYPALFAYALQWEAESEVSQIYNAILDILEGKYGVTEQQAREIAALKSDIAYTREVIAALEAAGYGDGSISADGLQKPGSAGSSEEQPENPADAGSSEGQPENPGDGGGLEGLPGETGDFDGMQTGADGNEGEPGDADDAAGQPDELPEEEEMESEEYVDNQ